MEGHGPRDFGSSNVSHVQRPGVVPPVTERAQGAQLQTERVAAIRDPKAIARYVLPHPKPVFEGPVPPGPENVVHGEGHALHVWTRRAHPSIWL